MALASVEDEVEISSAGGGGATISQGAGAVSPRVNPDLSMYPTGKRVWQFYYWKGRHTKYY